MWIHGDRNTPSHCEYGEDTLPKGGGLQNALDGGVTFQSEYSVGQINPVEVEGQNDIYGAEADRLFHTTSFHHQIGGHKRHSPPKQQTFVETCGEDMTERMRDAFVVRDLPTEQTNMIPSQKERPMAMGDGTFMSDNAFKESIPMMSYTPEELGINMSAYPMPLLKRNRYANC